MQVGQSYMIDFIGTRMQFRSTQTHSVFRQENVNFIVPYREPKAWNKINYKMYVPHTINLKKNYVFEKS